MPTYQVLVKAYSVVVVQAVGSEEEATKVAIENLDMGDFDMDVAYVEEEIIDIEHLSRSLRHCNKSI